MADIVNLRLARKRKARAGKEREAERNRTVHGRSRAERERDRKAAEASEKFIAGHKRDAALRATPTGASPADDHRHNDE